MRSDRHYAYSLRIDIAKIFKYIHTIFNSCYIQNNILILGSWKYCFIKSRVLDSKS